MTDNSPPKARRDPILRVVPAPADINSNGHIFGGWVLSQMDIAGGNRRRADRARPDSDSGDRGDGVYRADPAARYHLGLCPSRAARAHLDGHPYRSDRNTRGAGRKRSRSPAGCLRSSRSTKITGRARCRRFSRAQQSDSQNCGCRWPERGSPKSATRRDAAVCAAACRALGRNRRKSRVRNLRRTD